MQKNILFALLLAAYVTEGLAQQLLSPSYSFSHKKTSYITMADGNEIKGTIKDIDRKKGLIKYVKIKDGSGKKHKLKPNDIKFMYLPPSGIDKYAKAAGFLTDAQKWNDEKLDQDLLNQRYVYFENTDVKIKKKQRPMLMQLLNPTFSSKVKVYHDPFAKKTMSVGVGSVDVVGGNAKSYYVQAGSDEAAYRLKKKHYKKEFVPMWDDCKTVIDKYSQIRWTELTQHIIDYTECK